MTDLKFLQLEVDDRLPLAADEDEAPKDDKEEVDEDELDDEDDSEDEEDDEDDEEPGVL